MKIGIDLHGTLDKDPEGFKKYIKKMTKDGHKVYILTGSSCKDAVKEIEKLKIKFNKIKIISTTDYLIKEGYDWEYDRWNRPSFANSIWWGAKAEIAKKIGLDLHIDDRQEYSEYFETPFILWSN